jgi:hypothetical protein
MNAILIRRQLTSHVVDLPELEPMVGKAVEIIVLEEPEWSSKKGPKAGTARGKVQMSADFDAPLDEFAEYT